jgi:hypothetical protein
VTWSAGVALVAALALVPAARARAAAAEAAPLLVADAVEVTVVGTPEDLERVRGLALSRALGGRIRWLRLPPPPPDDHFDLASVLAAPPAAGDAAVRGWVDLTDAHRARLTFATRSERFLIRDVELSGRFDEVDRAALAEVLELSVSALLENERAGLSRDEAQALLARRAAPPAPPPGEPAAPLPPPPPPEVPSRWAAGAFYGAQAAAGDAPIAHGPGLLLSVAHDPRGQRRGQGLSFWLSGQWNTLDATSERAGARIGVGLDTVAARAGIEIGNDAGVGLRAGLGADFVHIAPRAVLPDPSIALSPERWSTHFIVSLAGRVNLAVLSPVRVAGLFVVDFTPTAVSYDAVINGTPAPVFSPGRLRPGIVIELHVHQTRTATAP